MLFIMFDDQFEKQYADTQSRPHGRPLSSIGGLEPATLLNLQLAIYLFSFGGCVQHLGHMSQGFESFMGARECLFECLFFYECECECICCSFHLNYPVADLPVTTWRCAILKHFISHAPVLHNRTLIEDRIPFFVWGGFFIFFLGENELLFVGF